MRNKKKVNVYEIIQTNEQTEKVHDKSVNKEKKIII